jgi:shikimate dehydrogenase
MLNRLNVETLPYPILGDPITFVRSPRRLTAELEARGHNGICVPMQVPNGSWELSCVALNLSRMFADC